MSTPRSSTLLSLPDELMLMILDKAVRSISHPTESALTAASVRFTASDGGFTALRRPISRTGNEHEFVFTTDNSRIRHFLTRHRCTRAHACGSAWNRSTGTHRCLDCAVNGVSLLYVCQRIFGLAVPLLYQRSEPRFSSRNSLSLYSKAVLQFGHQDHLTRVELYLDCFNEEVEEFKDIDPGTLTRTFPKLRQIFVHFKPGPISSANWLDMTPDLYADMFSVEKLRTCVSRLVNLTAGTSTLKSVIVSGLQSPEVTAHVQQSIMAGSKVPFRYPILRALTRGELSGEMFERRFHRARLMREWGLSRRRLGDYYEQCRALLRRQNR